MSENVPTPGKDKENCNFFFFFLFNFNNIKYVIIVIHITIVETHAKGLMLTSLFYFLSFLLSQHTYMYIHDISNKLVYTMVFLTVLVSI